jgi:hypothetical protein
MNFDRDEVLNGENIGTLWRTKFSLQNFFPDFALPNGYSLVAT